MLGLVAGGGADDFAVDEEIDAGFAVVSAAADEEGDVVAVDDECGRGERAAGAVAVEKRVDQAAAEKAIDLLLVGKGSVGGCFAERLAGDCPAGVVVAFEIGEEDIIGGEGRRKWNADKNEKCPADH